MKKICMFAGFLSLAAFNAQTGNTGINTTSPKATLDVNLPTSYANGQLAGVTIPQLTGDQVEAMSATAGLKVGTIVYATAISTAANKDITAVGYWYWKDATDKWEPFTLGTSADGNTVDWSVNGNTGTTAANYLGTKNNQPLNFKTNATTDTNPKMTILPNGNVGIGISNPGELLHIKSGKVLVDGNVIESNNLGRIDGFAGFGTKSFKTGTKGTGFLSFLRSNGTDSSIEYVSDNDILGYIVGSDLKSNLENTLINGPGNGASIQFISRANFTASNKPTAMTFSITKPNSIVFSEAMRIDENGSVGIGTITPQYSLDVIGNIGFSSSTSTVKAYLTNVPGDEPALYDREIGLSTSATTASEVDRTSIYIAPSGSGSFMNKGRVQISGRQLEIISNVSIGTSGAPTPIEKLEVSGNIRATGVFKSSTSASITYPDYVFQKYYKGNSSLKPSYQFLSLDKLEKFIKTNGHLPGYKSAKEIEKEGSIDITTNTLINQEKIEELYLHTIEQNKKIEKQQKQIEELQSYKKENEDLKKRLEALEAKLK